MTYDLTFFKNAPPIPELVRHKEKLIGAAARREPWRSVDAGTIDAFVKHIGDTARERSEYGVCKYGSEFVGEPLAHLEEELLDALFYLYIARRKYAE